MIITLFTRFSEIKRYFHTIPTSQLAKIYLFCLACILLFDFYQSGWFLDDGIQDELDLNPEDSKLLQSDYKVYEPIDYMQMKNYSYLGLYETGFTPDVRPISFHQGRMSPKLLELLQSDRLFSAPEDELTTHGMYHIDILTEYPMLPFHTYYEGYFHAIPKKGKLKALNVRFDLDNPGAEMYKYPAPLALRAFINVLVELNPMDELIEAMPDDLYLKKYFKGKKYFRDIAVQMHWGQGLPKRFLRWHWDAMNSVIHMGISIRGTRFLWQINQMSEDSELQYEWREQTEGDFYISSPHGVMHAPQYPATTFDTRIIAIMCRIYLSSEDYMNIPKNESLPVLTRVTDWLQTRTLLTPTYEETLKEMKRIMNE